MKQHTWFVAACLLACAPAVTPALAQPIVFTEAAGLRHACGGVGAEERREMEALRRAGQLEILFTSEKRGAFVSGVDVEIAPRAATGAPTRFRAQGPTCLVEAAPGTWRVTARLGAAERTREVKLAATGARIVITFPDEAADGIRASEEEKRQARQP